MGSSADGSRKSTLAPGCVRLLEDAGFIHDRQIGVWLNRLAGRVIACDRVANSSSDWLAGWLGLSRAHPLFIANGHDVRTVRFGRPGLVPVRDDDPPAPRPLRIRRRRGSFTPHHGRRTFASQLLRRGGTSVRPPAARRRGA